MDIIYLMFPMLMLGLRDEVLEYFAKMNIFIIILYLLMKILKKQ